MHFLVCLQNIWTYFSETHHNCLLAGPDDNDDISKIMELKQFKIKIT